MEILIVVECETENVLLYAKHCNKSGPNLLKERIYYAVRTNAKQSLLRKI